MGMIAGIFVLSLLGGWIVNYLADVLPRMRSLTKPARLNCGTEMDWKDYFLFHRCKTCGKPRRTRTFVVQLLIPALAIYLWLVPPHQLEFPLAFILLLYLLLLAIIDIEYRLILHVTSIVGAVLGLGIGLHLHSAASTLLGGAAGYLTMLAFYFLGELFVAYISKRRNEATDKVALGFGDVNLSGIMGLLLGWPGIAFGLLFTILAGGVVSLLVVLIMLIRRQYKAFYAIPYGLFLILSVLVLLFRP